MNALGQLTKNPDASFENASNAYLELKKLYPNNPFIPNLKDKHIIWASLIPVTAKMVY